MARLAMAEEAGGGARQGSRNQFSNNKGVNGVLYFKLGFSSCRMKTCKVSLTFLTKGRERQLHFAF